MLLDKLRQVPRPAWTIVTGLFFVGVGNYMVLPFFALYLTRELQLTAVDAGTILAVRLWTQRGLSLAGGVLADRFGGRNAMVLGLLLRFSGYLGLAFAGSFTSALLWTALMGMGSSLYTPAGKAALTRLAGKDNRLFLMSLRNTAGNVGTALGPPIGLIAAAFSYRWGFIAAAVLFLVFAALTLLAVPATAGSGAIDKELWQRLRTGAGNRRLWVLAGVSALYFAIHVQIELTMPLFAEQHFSTTAAALIFTVNAVTVFVLQLPLSSWAERLSSSQSMALGVAATGVGFLMLAAPGGLPMFLAGVVVFTLSEIVVVPRLDDEVGRAVPSSILGASFGLLAVANSIGGSLGSYGGGLYFGWAQKALSANALWVPFGVFACLAALVLYGGLGRLLPAPAPSANETEPAK